MSLTGELNSMLNLKNIKKNYSLAKYHTFGFNLRAKYFYNIKNIFDLKNIDPTIPTLVLGGGSNLIFTKDFEGLVLKNSLKYSKVISDTLKNVAVEFGSGTPWDKVCAWAVKNRLYGTENLSGIPGTIGAAPIQNIGAYGQELKDTFLKLKYYDFRYRKFFSLNKKQCLFGYRNSIFKTAIKENIFIVSVTLRLKKTGRLDLNYSDLASAFVEKKPTLFSLRKTILKIRASKLPNWKKLGNSGSFFKNPIIPQKHFAKLKAKYPDMKSYPDPDGVKINAGYLIEKAGFKGYRLNQVGVYDQHALILVNLGNGNPKDLLILIEKITHKVENLFSITLVPEVNIY